MALTEKQELYIARYLEEVRQALHGQLSSEVREEAVNHLRLRIIEEALKFAGDQKVDDLQILGVLKQQGPAVERAASLVCIYRLDAQTASSGTVQRYAAPHAKPGHSEAKASAPAARTTPAKKEHAPEKAALVWLGVCRYFADSLSLPLWLLRTLAVVAGLIAAPIALCVYMGLFFFLNSTGALAEQKKTNYFRCGLHLFLTGLFILLFHLAGKYGIEGILRAHQQFFEQSLELSELAGWAWLSNRGGSLFFWALCLLMPPALLSGLPLSSEWSHTLKRVTQAGVALYAILIASGLASLAAGILITFYGEFTH
jgi:phage shock protein PspC (stress-responsive transcriptional regulator)